MRVLVAAEVSMHPGPLMYTHTCFYICQLSERITLVGPPFIHGELSLIFSIPCITELFYTANLVKSQM